MKESKIGRIPVSTIRTGCIPFNVKQKAASGYKVGENPVKETGRFIASFDEALSLLQTMDHSGWRDYGKGNSQSAHKAIGWVTKPDAKRLLAEDDSARRVQLFESLTDVVYI